MFKEVNGVRLQMSDKEESEWTEQLRIDTEAKKARAWLIGRESEYPDWKLQFDQIWHEVNRIGSISAGGEWFQKIKAIKDKYPKPV